MDIIKQISSELGIRKGQVESTIKLIDEGNTIPFIARYRKEVTGSLDDEILRKLGERLEYLRGLEDRKKTILSSIEEQGKLTEELKKEIKEALTMVVLEDLYRPYKPKRRTRATIAKEKGLEPLANIIILQMTDKPIEEEAKEYIDEEKEVFNEEEAISGALDIIAENVSDEADYRSYIRDIIFREGYLISNVKEETESVFEMYYDYKEEVKKIPGHRILAINRGEKGKILSIKIEAPEERIFRFLEKKLMIRDNPHTKDLIKRAYEDSYKRLIAPSIEREVRSELTQKAEDGAIEVFGKNLEQLLMQPPISGQVILGWDPAFRTGCKLAVVDSTGKSLYTRVVFPTAPQNKVDETKAIVKKLIDEFNITLIAIGNGTASRESELIVAEIIKEIKKDVKYVIVNEAGASVYSASKLATEEFPDYDVGERSAISIARRLQDPLAELVKIDPKSIGIGQYQHDMNQKKLGAALTVVVEDCVNRVGIDLNTASAALLEYVSGISKAAAKNIVIYREEKGVFKSRKQLLKVPKIGPKAFEQSAGFLRIFNGTEPLDTTGVHPESYKATKSILSSLSFSSKDIESGGIKEIRKAIKDKESLATELGIGEITLNDIINELEKPGRDPREEMPKPILRTDVLDMEDLKTDMLLKGTVRNVVDFGAFVDVGVHQDGLVHISQLSNKRYVKHPLDVVSVGDVVDVKVMSVDVARKRIQLTMII